MTPSVSIKRTTFIIALLAVSALLLRQCATSGSDSEVESASTVEDLPISADDLVVIVADVGPGLGVLIDLPNHGAIVYDAGPSSGLRIREVMTEYLEPGEEVEMMFISHVDSDHSGGADNVIQEWPTKHVVRVGAGGDSGDWEDADAFIRQKEQAGELIDTRLVDQPLSPGTEWTFGQVRVTFLQGFGTAPEDWHVHGSHATNAVSIVLKVEYGGRSLLLTGDIVGREDGTADDLAAIASERHLIDSGQVLKSDIMVAPHHGADNGSAYDFIDAVSPKWVVFAAGNKYDHPRAVTAQRYLNAGVAECKLLRTDLGGDENRNDPEDKPNVEWLTGNIEDEWDKPGDDEILFRISLDGTLEVEQNGLNPCQQN